MRNFAIGLVCSFPLLLTGCGGDSPSDFANAQPSLPKPAEFHLLGIEKAQIPEKNALRFTWDGETKGNSYTVCLKDVTKENHCAPLATGKEVNLLEARLASLLDGAKKTYFILATNSQGSTKSTERTIEPDLINSLIQNIHLEAGQENEYFGSNIAISEDGLTMVVGAPRIDSLSLERMSQGESKLNAPSAYVYKKENSKWVRKQQLSDPDIIEFANNVDISADGKTIAIAIRFIENDIKGEFVQTYNKKDNGLWKQSPDLMLLGSMDRKVTPLSLNENGTKIAVGRSDRTEVINLDISMRSVVVPHSALATTLKLRGDQLFFADKIASNPALGEYSKQGMVKIFEWNGTQWSQSTEIRPADPQDFMDFGASITVNKEGTLLAVGAPKKAHLDQQASGAVYLYKKTGSNWDPVAVEPLVPTDATAFDHFGYSVAFNPDATQLVVGAIDEDSNGKGLSEATNENATNSGAAYLFAMDNGTWNQTLQIKAPDRYFHDKFAAALAWSGKDELVITAPYRDTRDTSGSTKNSGAIYVY